LPFKRCVRTAKYVRFAPIDDTCNAANLN